MNRLPADWRHRQLPATRSVAALALLLFGLLPNPAVSQLIERVPAKFPVYASSFGLSGRVIAEAHYDRTGRVVPSSIEIVEAAPVGFFEDAARDALLAWRFEPCGESACKFRQTFTFTMDQP